MKTLATLLCLLLALPALACPPAAQLQAPPGYMLVPVPRQQYAPQAVPPMQFAPARAQAYGAMTFSSPRGAYAGGGGAAVSVNVNRAVLPARRSTQVNVATGGGAAVSVRAGGRVAAPASARASGGCAT